MEKKSYITIKVPAYSVLLLPDTDEGMKLAFALGHKVIVVDSFYGSDTHVQPTGLDFGKAEVSVESYSDYHTRIMADHAKREADKTLVEQDA